MKELINKISKYEIFVKYIPGCAMVLFFNKLLKIDLLINNIIVDLFLIYFYGELSKFAGKFFCVLLEKLGLLKYVKYSYYINKKLTARIKNISRMISIIEAYIGVFIIVLISFLVLNHTVLKDKNIAIITILLATIIILFLNINYYLVLFDANLRKSKKTK